MLYTSPALAQSSAAPAVAPPVDAAATDRQSSDSGEIVVTAQRRTELARDVPISLTALSGDQLQAAGITDTQSLQTLTPGLKMDRVGNFTLERQSVVEGQRVSVRVDLGGRRIIKK